MCRVCCATVARRFSADIMNERKLKTKEVEGKEILEWCVVAVNSNEDVRQRVDYAPTAPTSASLRALQASRGD
jgi:hypothetical protein